MARSEVFSSDIIFDVESVKKARKQIEGLRTDALKAAKDIKAAFLTLGGIQLFDAKSSQKVTQQLQKNIKASISKLKVPPDFIFELESRIKQLSDKTSPEFLKIREQFNRLKAEARKTGSEFLPEDLLDRFLETSSAVDELGKSLEIVAEKAKMEKIAQELQKEEEAAKATQAQTEKLGEQFENVGKIGEVAPQNITQRFSQMRDGLRLARAEGGSFAVGMRQAFFGVGQSSNILAKGLDLVSRNVVDSTRLQNRFAEAGAKAANQVARFNNVLEAQALSFAKAAKERGVDMVQLNQFRRGIIEIEDAFEKAGRTIRKGGDATGQLLEAEDATRRWKEQIQALRALGILKPEDLARLAEMEQGLGIAANATKVMAISQRAMKKEMEAAKEEEKKAAAQSKKTAGSKEKLAKAARGAGRAARQGADGIEEMQQSLRRVKGAARQTGDAFRQVFAGAAIGSFVGNILPDLLFGLRELGGEMVNLGAEAEELENKFNVVFGDVADRTNTQLELMAENFKRSIHDLRGQASQFQDTFVPIGFARDQAAEMSVAMTALTQDLSSFYDVSTDEVARALSSTLVGNTENMRQFGSIINEARINEELLNIGVQNTTRTATQQQKTMATLSLIFKDIQDAQGDLVRSGDSFTNNLRAWEGVTKDLKIAVGEQLLPALAPFLNIAVQFASSVGPRVIQVFKNMSQSLKPFVDAVGKALESGNINELVNLFRGALESGLNAVIDYLNGFIDQAFAWGQNFVVEIANGMFDAVGEVINAAIEIAESIASFLSPGSPPETGPLSTIDQWASGLVDTFNSGFEGADFDFMESALQSISDAFTKQNFEGVKQGLVSLVDEINRTGDFNTENFQKVADLLGEGNKEQIKTLELQLKYEKARKRALNLEKEVSEAQKAGFAPKQLRDKLNAAKKEESQAKKNLDLQSKFLKFQALSLDDFKRSSGAAGRAAGAAGRAGQRAARTARDAMARYFDFINTGYAEEKKILEEKLAAGAISQEEYLKGVIKLEEKYIDASLRTGQLSQVTKHSEQLKRFETELSALLAGRKQKAKDEADSFLPPIESILGDYMTTSGALAPGLKEMVTDLGTQLATSFSEAARVTFEEKVPQAVNQIGTSFKQRFVAMGQELQSTLGGDKGMFARILASAVGGHVVRIAFFKLSRLFVSLTKVIAPFAKNWRLLLKIGLKWSLIGGGLVLIFENWDKIMAGFNIAVTEAKRIWSDFLDNFGGAEKLFGDVQAIVSNLSETFTEIGQSLRSVAEEALAGDLGESLKNLFAGDFSGLGQRLRDVFQAIPTEEILGALDFSSIDFSRIATFFQEIGESLLSTLSETLERWIGEENFANLLAFIENLKAQFAAAFEEGELLGEIVLLFGQLKELFVELLPTLKVVGAILGAVLALAINTVVSALTSLRAVLPFITDAMAGIVRAIRGVVTVFTGIVQQITAGWDLIVAIFTGGDVEGALQGVKDAFQTTMDGIGLIFSGLLQTVVNFGAAIISTVLTFAADFIANIAMFGDDSAKEFSQTVRGWAGTITSFFSDLFDDFPQKLAQLGETIRLGWEAFGLIMKTGFIIIINTILFKLDEAITMVQGWGTSIKTTLQNAWTEAQLAVSRAILNIISSVQNGWNNVVSTVRRWGQEIRNFFTVDWHEVGLVVGRNIAALPGTVAKGGRSFITAVKKLTNTVIELFRTGLKFWGDIIRNTITNFPTILREGWQNFISTLKILLGSLLLSFQVGFAVLGTAIGLALIKFPVIFREKWGILVTAVKEKAAELGTIIQTNWENYKERIGDAVAKIPGLFTEKWKEVVSTVTTKGEEIGTTIQTAWENFGVLIGDTIANFPEIIRSKFGEILTTLTELGGEISQGFLDSLGAVGEFFKKDDSVSEGAREETEKTRGFFQGLKDGLIGNSIVPEMVSGIVLSMTDMGFQIGLIVQQMQLQFTTAATVITRAWLTMTRNITTTWQRGMQAISKKLQDFGKLAGKIFKQITKLVQKLVSALREVTSATKEAEEALRGMSSVNMSELTSAMDHLADTMKRARREAGKYAGYLKAALKYARELGGTLGGNVEAGGGGFQTGILRVPRTMRATIHRDETILPSGIAGAFRGLVEALRSGGIGREIFNVPGQRPNLANGGGPTIINMDFENAFPNVSSANEAEGIVEILNDLIDQGRAYSKVSID